MNTLVICTLTNVVIASVIYLAVSVCKRWVRNSAVLHVLWVFVLLKLLTPPLWSPRLAWLPPVERATLVDEHSAVHRDADPRSPFSLPTVIDSEPRTTGGEIVKNAPSTTDLPVSRREVATSQSTGIDVRPTASTGEKLMQLVIAAWGTGSLMWFVLAGYRISRFQRCLRFVQQVPEQVQHTAAALAGQLGLRRCPQVWIVPGRVSPMLWFGFGPARVILPADLFAELDGPSRDLLLLHELAHYRRGDHWVRMLEFACLGVYWWLPVVWLVRREIRAAEERACDAWVVSCRPDERRTYAEMLVKTVGFISLPSLPAIASGIGSKGGIERRIIMIMRTTIDFRISRRAGIIVCLLACGLLPLAPTLMRAQQGTATAAAPPQAPAAALDTAADAETAGEKLQPARANESRSETVPVTVVGEEDKPFAGVTARILNKEDGPSAKNVLASIDSAKRVLLKAQQQDGSWKTGGGWGDQFPVGVSSLALLALLNSGMSVTDPEIQRGLTWLRKQQPTATYEISLMIQVLAAAKDGRRDIAKVAALVNDLEDMQVRQGANSGSWSYTKTMRNMGGGGDRSNGQFAVLALREAQEMGVPVSFETWKRAALTG